MVISWKPSVQNGHRLLGEEFCTDENFLGRVSYGELVMAPKFLPGMITGSQGRVRYVHWDVTLMMIWTVSELLLTNGQGWDENKLRQHFAEVDVTDILQTCRTPGIVGLLGLEFHKEWFVFSKVGLSPWDAVETDAG
jgi:hypothetical protein